MERRKVVVWGNSIEYDYFRKWLEVELLKGSIEICAIILNEENLFGSIDGIGVIQLEDLMHINYDYLIDMNRTDREEALRILELLRVPRDKVIPAPVFWQPYFDFKRWEQVKESKVSIVASHCWGGFAYNTLGLQFMSPFVNMFVKNEDFFKLLGNFEYYMKQPLYLIGEAYETNLKRNYPVVGLDDVTIDLNHYTDFDSAVEMWNRRKARINYDNLFIEMAVNTEEELERFLQLPYEHKICFTTIPCDEKTVVSIQSEYLLSKYKNNTWDIANKMVSGQFIEAKQYDLLKLLNHEPDYKRVAL